METRKCKTCEEDKPLESAFRPTNSSRKYFMRECKLCQSKAAYERKRNRMESDPEWRSAYLEKERVRQKARYDKEVRKEYRERPEVRARDIAHVRKYRKTEKGIAVARDNHLRKKFGITLADFNFIFESQRGVCRICGEENESGKSLALDHCHKSGQIRGLLCHRCNMMLGYARDSTDVLREAISYLNRDNEYGSIATTKRRSTPTLAERNGLDPFQ